MPAQPGRGVRRQAGPEPTSVQDKAAKIGYLQKAFAAVQAATGRPVEASPAKARQPAGWCTRHPRGRGQTWRCVQIVAGLEPQATNAFLQLLAEAAAGGLSAQAPAPPAAAEVPVWAAHRSGRGALRSARLSCRPGRAGSLPGLAALPREFSIASRPLILWCTSTRRPQSRRPQPQTPQVSMPGQPRLPPATAHHHRASLPGAECVLGSHRPDCSGESAGADSVQEAPSEAPALAPPQPAAPNPAGAPKAAPAQAAPAARAGPPAQPAAVPAVTAPTLPAPPPQQAASQPTPPGPSQPAAPGRAPAKAAAAELRAPRTGAVMRARPGPPGTAALHWAGER